MLWHGSTSAPCYVQRMLLAKHLSMQRICSHTPTPPCLAAAAHGRCSCRIRHRCWPGHSSSCTAASSAAALAASILWLPTLLLFCCCDHSRAFNHKGRLNGVLVLALAACQLLMLHSGAGLQDTSRQRHGEQGCLAKHLVAVGQEAAVTANRCLRAAVGCCEGESKHPSCGESNYRRPTMHSRAPTPQRRTWQHYKWLPPQYACCYTRQHLTRHQQRKVQHMNCKLQLEA